MVRSQICKVLSLIAFLSLLTFSVEPGCEPRRARNLGENDVSPSKSIDSVKEAHTKELMSIPGVVGVYIGELDDQRPCIGVMVVKKTPEIEQKVPKNLEGYPVRIDETGLIKPMQ